MDGVKQWRRLSGVETAKAFGIREEELSQFQHLTDNEIHAAVGNGVCIEMGEAMGQILRSFGTQIGSILSSNQERRFKKMSAVCKEASSQQSMNQLKRRGRMIMKKACAGPHKMMRNKFKEES